MEQIKQMISETEKKFDQIKAQMRQKQQEVTYLEDELKRLQGEYRTLKQLEKSANSEEQS